jgi:translation initiation factor 2D
LLTTSLWELGTKPVLDNFPLPAPYPALGGPPPASKASSSVAQIESRVEALSVSAASEASATQLASSDVPAAPASPPLSASEVSTLLSAALMQVLSIAPPSFPIPASQLYSGYILQSRPAYIPLEKRDDVVIARSEWKKLAKWMKELGKDGVVKTKETKGEVVITG